MPVLFRSLSYSILAGALLACGQVQADADGFAWGPAVGSEIPHSLSALDASGTAVDFADVVGPRGTVLFFFRSADWCRFCKRQLVELNEHVTSFRQRGVSVVGISYDSPEILAGFAAENDLGFTLLSDTGSEIIKAFGILNTRYKPGKSGYGIPNPGVVMVSPDREVVATFAEKSYRKRPQIDELIAALDQTLVAPAADSK